MATVIKLYNLKEYLTDRRIAIDFTTSAVRDNWLSIYLMANGTFSNCQYIKNVGHTSLVIDLELTVAQSKTLNYLSIVNDTEPTYYYYVDKVEYISDACTRLTCTFDEFMNYYAVENDRHVLSTDWTILTKRHFDRWSVTTHLPIIQDVAQSQQFTQEQKSRTLLPTINNNRQTYLCLRKQDIGVAESVWDIFTSAATTVTTGLNTAYTMNVSWTSDLKSGECFVIPAGVTVDIKVYNPLTGVISYTKSLTNSAGYFWALYQTSGGFTFRLVANSGEVTGIYTGVSVSSGETTILTINNTFYKVLYTAGAVISWPSYPFSEGVCINGSGSMTTKVYSVNVLSEQVYSAVRVLPFYIPSTGLKANPYDIATGITSQYLPVGLLSTFSVINTIGIPAFDVAFTTKNRVAYNDPKLYHSQYTSYLYAFEDQVIEKKNERMNGWVSYADTIALTFSANGLSSVKFELTNPYYTPVNENDIRKIFVVNNSIPTFTNNLDDWTNNFKQIDDALYNQKNTQIIVSSIANTALQVASIAGMTALAAATGGASVAATAAIKLGVAATSTAIGIGTTIFNVATQLEQNKLGYQRQKEQMLNSIINASGSPVDLTITSSASTNLFCIKYYTFGLKAIDKAVLDDMFFYEGYETLERTPMEAYLHTRTYFNYIKADADFTLTDTDIIQDKDNLNGLKQRFKDGLTIMHCALTGAGPYTDVTDWDQSLENWEVTH